MKQGINALLRTLVWLGAFAWWIYLKKPDGSSVLAVRPGLVGGLGLGFVAGGLALHLWSLSMLTQGIEESLSAPVKLLRYGPYKYVRNPLYLGAAMIFAGLTLLYAPLRAVDLWGALVIGILVQLVVVRVEEPATRKRLGADYDDYCRRVPRWIPRFSLD